MVAGLGGSVATTSHLAGLGRLQARTILLGPQTIAVDNIGTMEIVRGRRSWLLFVLGMLVVAGSATQINGVYQLYAAGGVGLGLLLIVINLMQRVERGLAIGACDGRGALIVSRDEIFLQRLLTLLTDRINTRDETLLATFDIVTGRISVENAPVQGPFDVAPAPAPAQPHANGFDAKATPHPAATEPAPEPAEDSSVVEIDVIDPPDAGEDALFGETSQSQEELAPPPAAPAPPPVVSATAEAAPDPAPPVRVQPARVTPPPQRAAFDPVLDGGRKANGADDDWLSRPRPEPAAPRMAPEPEGGGAGRVFLAILIIVMLGAVVFAAWYFTGQTGPSTSISLIAGSEATREPAPEIRGATQMETPLAEPAAESAVPETPETPSPEAPFEAMPYTPPEPMVARGSGLQYRASPSTAEDIAVLAETRAGGEPLSITGRARQADGEWLRVTLLDGRDAWLKGSEAVERARFSETIRPGSEDPGLSFAASTPRILEPAEGVPISGGPQTVRLAWAARDGAERHIVEIESYDALAQRWESGAETRRVTVEGNSELAEAFNRAGYWRWRVRSVSAGEQSQPSRWAAFSIRN